jgi:O-antigen/teichoic acid export membrane protein
MLASFFTGQGVSIMTQLLVPPLFLHRYASGIEVYGEWIALSAAVSYLNTLNYGIQTYVTNQTTIYFNRGEVEAAKGLQASALLLLLLIIVAGGVAGVSLLFMPVGHWLGLRHVASRAASLTLYLLLLQILFNMLASLLSASYMAVGKAHRGINWGNCQRLVSVLAISVFVWFRAPFPVLALAQLASVLLMIAVLLVDLRRTAPILLPSVRNGSWKGMAALLKPSGHFGLLAVSGFLTWQAPVLLIQKILGPATVGVFALVRVVFAMGRQALAILSFSIAQEITHLVGQRNWPQLRRLYDLSERVVLLMVPIFSVGILLLSPFLFAVWLHRRNLYEPSLCFMMALVSAIMGIKEHKSQFQSSSNEHERLSRFMLISYVIALLISAFLLRPFGVIGFMFVWLAVEVLQTIYILRLNVRLFAKETKISMAPMVRFGGVLALGFGIAAWPAYASRSWPLGRVVGVALVTTLLLSLVSYYAFGLNQVRSLIEARIRRRLIPSVESGTRNA